MSLLFNKIAGAVLGTAVLGMGLGFLGEAIFHMPAPAKPGYDLPGGEVAAAGGEAKAAAPVAVAPIADRLKTADAKAGEALMSKKCASCHDWTAGGPNKVGPNLHGVFGRVPGSKEGFTYSAGMVEHGKGGAWDADKLDAFITSPKDVVKGTKMSFAGLPDGADRANVIAFLESMK